MQTFSILVILVTLLFGMFYIAIDTSYQMGYKSAIKDCEIAVEESAMQADIVFRFSDGRIAIIQRQWPKKQLLWKAISIYEKEGGE